MIHEAKMVIKILDIMKKMHCRMHFGLKKATTFPSRVTDIRGKTEKEINFQINNKIIFFHCKCLFGTI